MDTFHIETIPAGGVITDEALEDLKLKLHSTFRLDSQIGEKAPNE